MERALLEVAKFLVIYFVFNMGFALAFEVLLRGTTSEGVTTDPHTAPHGSLQLSSIGTAMIQLVRYGWSVGRYCVAHGWC
jgi:hypothetical protein